MIVHSYMVPIVYDSHLDNKRYVVADSNWTEVDKSFQWKDIQWFQRFSKGRKSEALKINIDWEVAGSKGKTYKVEVNDDRWSCTCPAFGWSGSSRSCKHIDAIKKENSWK